MVRTGECGKGIESGGSFGMDSMMGCSFYGATTVGSRTGSSTRLFRRSCKAMRNLVSGGGGFEVGHEDRIQSLNDVCRYSSKV